MRFLGSAVIARIVALVLLVGGGAAVAVLAAARSEVAGRVEDQRTELASLTERADGLEGRASDLQEEVDAAGHDLSGCVKRIDTTVRQNNALAREAKATVFTSFAQVDAFIARVARLRDQSRQDIKSC